MNDSIGSRIKHAWSAFNGEPDELGMESPFIGPSYGYRQDRSFYTFNNGRDTVAAIYNQLAVDVSSNKIRHVKVNEDGFFLDVIKSGLNECLTVSANIDQTGRALMQDACMTMFEEGVIAIVPIETDLNPNVTGGYDIRNLRVGKIVEWFPDRVRVNIYNEKKGVREDIIVRKTVAAIVENPLYSVMNEPNSTLKRLMAKLALLDTADNQMAAGKLDLIIQLPYVIRTEQKRSEAEKRRKDIERQLTGSKYGIAYTDGTERITQLNRPAENTLLQQVDNLTSQLFSQLGLTKEVFEGTASQEVMLNYQNRTIEPLTSAITDAMHRTFLTKTARTQGQAIMSYRDPFKFLPIDKYAEVADKFITNRVFDPNEVRGRIGVRPHEDPGADHLQNPNIDVQGQATPAPDAPDEDPEGVIDIQVPEEEA